MRDDQALRISYDTLRVLIGVLGVSLPLFLVLGYGHEFQPSISDYYFTNMRDYFEGVLFFLGVFLIAYRPYGDDGWQDKLITNFSGACAILVALFPTYNPSLDHVPRELVFSFVTPRWSGYLHNAGAAGLFLSFAVLSLWYFTKGKKGSRTAQKTIRNGLYIVCGLGIVACLGFIAIIGTTGSIFWPETLALALFGLSWLVKGNAIPFLNDRPSKP
jgi:hypothetical protein